MDDYRETRALLARYWEGSSRVEEEQRLKAFFNQNQDDLPADLEQAADLFRFFSAEAEVTGTHISFSDKAQLYQNAEEKNAKKRPLGGMARIGRYWEYAAITLLIVGSALWFQVGGNPSAAGRPALDTYQSPEKAFAATQKALQLIAANLNKSKTEMQKLALFHEATQQVARKPGNGHGSE